MAKPNCSACDELREKAPNLIVNGLGDTECTSLANNTGLNPSSGNDDCDDLHNLNDCLIGNMEQEIDAYDVCDWKEYMRKFVENTWTVFKGIICAICGIWTRIARLDCYINFLLNDKEVGSLLDESAFVPGTGVSFERSDEQMIKPSIRINGNTYTVSGSIKIDTTTQHWGRLGLTNTGNRVKWGDGDGDYNRINTPNGNYTICLIKIPKSLVPWLRGLSSCVGSFVNAGVGQIFVQAVDGDSSDPTLPGQWGADSSRITVSAGQIWIRVSLIACTTWGIEYGDNTADVTFRATGLARSKSDGIEC